MAPLALEIAVTAVLEVLPAVVEPKYVVARLIALPEGFLPKYGNQSSHRLVDRFDKRTHKPPPPQVLNA
jgi:hypothetical protein